MGSPKNKKSNGPDPVSQAEEPDENTSLCDQVKVEDNYNTSDAFMVVSDDDQYQWDTRLLGLGFLTFGIANGVAVWQSWKLEHDKDSREARLYRYNLISLCFWIVLDTLLIYALFKWLG